MMMMMEEELEERNGEMEVPKRRQLRKTFFL